VQRILSLATLGVLGGLVWMFLSGGGLTQPGGANGPGAPQQQAGGWNSGGGFGGFQFPTATRQGSQPYAPVQPISSVTAPPPGIGPTIKIASYNIQVFGEKKAENNRVMLTLVDIIRQFQVIAIQEIRNKDQYFMQNFMQLVNRPMNQQDAPRHYDCIVGPPLGDSTSSSANRS
jgi:hypothetical protein